MEFSETNSEMDEVSSVKEKFLGHDIADCSIWFPRESKSITQKLNPSSAQKLKLADFSQKILWE
jgi:hypothetical protein